MSSGSLNSLIRIIIALSLTEAVLFTLQYYLYPLTDTVAIFTLHSLMLSIVGAFIIRAFLSRQEQPAPETGKQSSDYYKFAIDQHSIVATTDIKGIIQEVNDKFCEISGYDREELIGRDHRIINSGNKDKEYWRNMYRTVARGKIWKDEVKNRAKDGSYYWVDTTIIPLMNDNGKPQSYISIRTDITKQKNIQKAFKKTNKQLKKLTQMDELTGIPNRRSYEKRLETEIQAAQRSSLPLSLLVVDIDNFKIINDDYGHDTGDQVLRRVAAAMSDLLTRTTDFIARFGGEEFVVLMPSTDEKGAFKVAERIRNQVINTPIRENQSSDLNKITVSIGISTQTGTNLDKFQLFKEADTALYEAKNSGKNKSILFRH